MNRRRILTTAALAATTLALPATAGASGGSSSSSGDDCLRYDSSDDRAIAYTFTGNTLKLTPREPGEVFRVKVSKRRAVKVTKTGDAYVFDIRDEEGETFKATERRSSDGKLRLRVRVAEADGDFLTRFEVRVKAHDTVECENDEEGDEDRDRSEDKHDKGEDRSGDKDDDGDRRGHGRGRNHDEDED